MTDTEQCMVQVETPQCAAQNALMRSSDTEMWPPAGEQLDQSGSNDFSAFKEVQELKEGGHMLRWVKMRFSVLLWQVLLPDSFLQVIFCCNSHSGLLSRWPAHDVHATSCHS